MVGIVEPAFVIGVCHRGRSILARLYAVETAVASAAIKRARRDVAYWQILLQKSPFGLARVTFDCSSEVFVPLACSLPQHRARRSGIQG